MQMVLETTSLDVVTKEVCVAQRKGLRSGPCNPSTFRFWGDEELTKGTEKKNQECGISEVK